MQPLKSFVREVEDAIASGEDAKRVETLRRLTTLFVDQSPNLNNDHVSVFDEVIMRLAHEIEFRARVELAERLADIANAPQKTVRDLAFDDNIEIARPILERSTRLEEDDLVSIAKERGQGHLLALSNRANLTTAVTDVLVVRGDNQVVRTVAGNKTAAFSEMGFGTMVQRAATDLELSAVLETRSDLPAHHVQALMSAAKARALEEMRQSGVRDADLAAAIDASADELMRDNGPVILVSDLEAALPAVEAMAARGELNEEKIVSLVKNDRLAEALTGLHKIGAIPLDVVAHAYGAPHYDPLLFIVRGVRFGWPTFKLFLTIKTGRSAPPSLLKSAFASFESLSVPTAQRVMRFVNAKQRVAKH